MSIDHSKRYEKPIVFWALNHRLEKDIITSQLEDMKAHGIGGAILHPRSGLLTPYLSETYFEMIGWIIEEAERIDLDIWLYDEDPYPSGIAGGKVTAEHPEFRAHVMKYISRNAASFEQIHIDIPLEKIVGAFAVRKEDNVIKEKIDLSGSIGLLRTEWRAERKYCTYYPTTYTKAKPQNRADTYGPYYSLDWTAPEGAWEVFVFYTEPIKDFWLYPNFTDLLNPDAVQYFIDITYEPYKKRFGKHFGKRIKGFFVDEPKYLSEPYPWTDSLPALFENRWNYSFTDALIALGTDFEGAEKIRRDFWETVQDRFIASFPKQVSEWCQNNDLELIGHCSPEEEPVDQVRYTGSISYFMRTMSIPGTDLITNQIGGDKYPILSLSPLLASSTSKQWHDGRVLCETFGVSEWELKHSDMIWMLNWLYSFGVNIFVIHVFMYSTDGYRKMDAGPSEFYQNPAWRYFGPLSSYMERVSSYFAETVSDTKTALFYPFDSWMTTFQIHHDRAFQLRDEFAALMQKLISVHSQFDFVDYRDFENASFDDGMIVIGNCRYSELIIPPVYYFSEEAKKTLYEAKKNGIKIYVSSASEGKHADLSCFGDYFISIDGNAESGIHVGLPEEISRTIRLNIVSEKSSQLIVSAGNNNGKTVYWIFNPLDETVCADVSENWDAPAVEVWNPAGDFTEIIEASEALCIPGRTSVVISPVSDIVSTREKELTRKELSGCWEFIPGKRNVLRLNEWVLGENDKYAIDEVDFEHQMNIVHPGQLSGNKDIVLPGEVTYKTIVDIDSYQGKMFLVREESAISGDWEILVNGQSVDNWERSDNFDCMEFSSDLSDFVSSADNRLYRRGELTITVKLRAQNGTDGLLQPLYLLGDFKVKLNYFESIGAELCNIEEPNILYTGSWADQGYPHFAGYGTYRQTFEMEKPEKDCEYFVEAYSAGNPFTVYLNDSNVGTADCEPYQVRITDAIREGTNCIEIETANTPVNMLYNLHQPSGLTKPVFILKKA